MLTLFKSTVLGAAFLSGVAIAACQPPGPQIAALPPANTAPANVAPETAAVPLHQTPSGPTLHEPLIGRDGSYAGSMTEVASGARGPPHYCLRIPQTGQHEDRAGRRHDFV
jgi:hypothetical protein